jgi:hypothetical protein
VDVRRRRSLQELAASTGGSSSVFAGDGASVVCTEDGISGNRVQAVYAYPAGGSDNYAMLAPYIRHWAGIADRVFNDSAAETGGVRHIRFVTSPDCQLEVAKAVLSPDGVTSLSGTAADLASQGFDRPDRKYLVWVDAYVFCGVATVKPDDRPSPDNPNNGDGEPGMVARVDRGCWGNAASSTEAHELLHVLGGVQPTAPDGTDNYHCADEAELMCYDDDSVADGLVWTRGGQVRLRSACPSWHERLFDCNHDDYFHTSPPEGSYLAEHWNVAQSSFLTSEGPASVPDTTAPVPTGPVPKAVGTVGSKIPVELRWSSTAPDVAGYWLWQSVDGRAWTSVPRDNPAEARVVLTLPRGHTYRFLVHAYDAAGNASPAVFGPRFAIRLHQEGSSRITYVGRWRRQYRASASARHQAAPRARRTRARFSFRGRAVAWVSRRGPLSGSARVYVDGRYVGTVRLHSATTRARAVVFSRRWSRSGRHRLTVRPTRRARRVPIDGFVVLR